MNDTENAAHTIDPHQLTETLGFDDLRDVAQVFRSSAQKHLEQAARQAGELWGVPYNDLIEKASFQVAAAESIENVWDSENPLEEEDE